MESIRSGPHPQGRTGDSTRSRAGTYTETPKEGLPSGLSRRARKEAENLRAAGQGAPPQAKGASRIPQASSTRRPSIPSQTTRPPLTHETQSWSSVASSSGSGKSGPHAPVSSSTSSSRSQQPRNVLRRKHSNLSQELAHPRHGSHSDSCRTGSSSSIPRSSASLERRAMLDLDRGLTESPTEIRVAEKVELPTLTAQAVTIYPELDRYRDVRPPPASNVFHIEMPHRIATHDLPPPTPLFSGASSQVSGFSGSPSTRFSESPGPGPYSRDTTPTSMSSQSPGLVLPVRVPPSRMRQPSPAQSRPPVTRRRAGSVPNDVEDSVAGSQGLAAVRESLNSSSSNSTVRDGDKRGKKKKVLPPPPPSPPPRKSSQKFKKSRDEQPSPPKPSQEVSRSAIETAVPAKATPGSRYARPVPAAASPKASAPTRPSRDGTPDLQSLGLPFPVIQSNLSSTSLPERRVSSSLAPSSLPRSATSGSQPDRPPQASRLPVGREPTPVLRMPPASDQPGGQQEPGRTVRTPSPGVSGFRTMFPLFGRRPKPAQEAQAEKKTKPPRKGPAAGTGHEGYGRLGAVRRRSSSTASNGTKGFTPAVSSQESLASTQSHDPFFMERMNPVVIAGGEVVENRNTSSELNRTESNQSLALGVPSHASRNNSQVSLSSRDEARGTLWPSAFPRGATQAPSLGRRRPSDSSDSEGVAMKSTLAYRRSVQRLRSPDQEPLRLPKPIVVRPTAASPSIDSLDASVMSDDSFYDPLADAVRGRKETTPVASKKLTKKARSPRKWNLFGRSQAQPEKVNKEAAEAAAAAMVAATVKAVQHKPVAFYTIMDSSEQEDSEMPDVEDVLREAQVIQTGLPTQVSERKEGQQRPPVALTEGQGPVKLAQAAPVSTSARIGPSPILNPGRPSQGPAHSSVREASATPTATARPSRLPQVGRIPKVISATRPEPPSPRSFSRPFKRASMKAPPPRFDVLDTESVAKGPSPPKPRTPELTLEGSTMTSGRDASPPLHLRLSQEISPPVEQNNSEFLRFSPRKNDSQHTSTTTSTSSGLLAYANATAVVPEPDAPLAEDEVWDEYNDLLGDDSMRVPPSAGSSQGRPFHLEILRTRLATDTDQKLESPTVVVHTQSGAEEAEEPGVRYTSSVYSADTAAQVSEALDAAGAATTPFSVTKFVEGYGDRNNSASSSAQQLIRKGGTSPGADARLSRASDASSCSQMSEDDSPLSQVNLRVGSMTVSKWLTFGHVLFSPVRDDLVPVDGSLKRDSILVVDGLGNDDWSFYAAETYPAATFYNLSPRAPLPTEHQNASAFPLSPPNHHQIQYKSHGDKFPFGAQSFTSVVYRFPPAAPEACYRNIIAEARRVLKPGGYIELSILDVDLNNMGNRSRRAVRRLKERIHTRAPETSLGSTSDLVVRLLGRKGFTEIKTCRVGVPVASTITRSPGSETSMPKASGKAEQKMKHKRDDRSLAEMMSDESPVADESITKMVAKVGRWWYTRCYERAAETGPASKSMWSDRALLSECEEWGTSLKLMVCHARVPDGRSRVASI